MNHVASLLVLAVAAAGCGGQELLLDTSPPVLIPNGGSAQAGQVDGPTAIPVTGAGAIVASAEPAATPPAPTAPLSVIDAAAIEATGADADVDAGVDGDAVSADGDGASEDDGPDRDDDPVEGEAAKVAPPPAVEVAKPPPPPTTRTVGDAGYALAIPAGWEDLDPTGLGSLFITSASRSMDPGEGFYTNVIVSGEPWAGDTQSYAVLSLSPIIEGGARIIATHVNPPTATHRGHVDLETYWINLTGTPYVTLQRYLTTGSVGYVITCAAAATTFEDHRETCSDIFESFVVDSFQVDPSAAGAAR